MVLNAIERPVQPALTCEIFEQIPSEETGSPSRLNQLHQTKKVNRL